MTGEWKHATLKDLCVVDWGNTNLTKAAYVEGGEYLAVSAAGCDGRIGHKEHSKHIPVLSAIGAQCGKMFFPEEDFTAIKNTITLTPREGLCGGRFLYYLLTSVDLPQRGAGQPFISKGDIQSFPVMFPALPEQQRIVGILDKAFDGIATAKVNAEKNLHNARALFESHLQAVFAQRRAGWIERPLGDLIAIQNGFAFKSSSYTASGHFVIRIGNVQEGEITLSNPKYVQLTDKRLQRFVLDEGDILVSLTGNIGRVGIVREEHLPAVLNQRVARITMKNRETDRDFLFRCLSSRAFRDSLQEAGHGAAQQNVSTKEIETVRIGVPRIAEQRQVVERFDAFAADVQRLADLYERRRAALDALKKSLLNQAFTGQL